MNKAQKRLVSALAAATSVAAAIAPAATVFAATKDDAKALLDNAKKTLAFVDYNQAYAAIVALPAADQPALLAELTPLWDKVATKDVTDILKTMEALAKDKDLKNYYDLYDMIEKTVSLPRNQQYLMGELTSWGKSAVFTPDVVAATDAVIKAYTDKTPESIAAAKELAAKVTNAGSLAWLNTEITNANKAVPVAVSSVTAKAANTFVVKFNKAIEDTTKVTFDVKKFSTPVTVTVAWNTDKTEATLTNSSNYSEGSYTVAVKNDTTDLGTSTVAVTAQKVAKIQITSSKLAVANKTVGSTQQQYGYATYKVLDQYGNDITNSYLANGLNFQSGVGNVAAKNGVLTVTPNSNINLIQFSQVVITGYDSTTGVSTTATLSTSTAVGTLNGIELKALKNADNKELTAGDNTTVFYIDYSAVDMSDNATADFKMVRDGLILSDSNNDLVSEELTVSAPSYVTARVVEDPTDSKKAAIEVKATSNTISMDLPVSITAMTYTGKTSTLNLTLKKQASVDSFTLMAPAYEIAVNETKEIPFAAYDQNGKQITKYSELTNSANMPSFSSNNVHLLENVDGTARLEVGPWATDGAQIITAVTKSGKMSSLTLNIQKAVKADSLTLGTKNTNLQVGADEKFDFYDAGGLTVKDQYGRTIDMKKYAANGYQVVATTSTAAGAALNLTSSVAPAGRNSSGSGNQVVVKAANAGTATVKFELINVNDGHAGTTADPHTVIDTKSMTFSVIANDDIKGYSLDAVASPIYTSVDRDATGTAVATTTRNAEYKANPKLWGLTASGAKVELAGTPIIGVYADNTNDFRVSTAVNNTTGTAFDSAKVIAIEPRDNSVAFSGSTNLTVTFRAVDGSVKSLSTVVKSTNAAPVASTVDVSVDTSYGGITVDGDTITVSVAAFAKNDFEVNDYVAFAGSDGNLTGGAKSKIYFYALDQYGKKASQLAQIVKVQDANGASDSEFNVDQYGQITAENTATLAGKYVKLTAVTSNGLAKTIKVVFTN